MSVFFQAPSLEATVGGGESNVALANYGFDAEFVTALPDNETAEACMRYVSRRHHIADLDVDLRTGRSCSRTQCVPGFASRA